MDTYIQPEDLQIGERIRVYLGDHIIEVTFTGYRYPVNSPLCSEKLLHFHRDGELADHYIGKSIRVESMNDVVGSTTASYYELYHTKSG